MNVNDAFTIIEKSKHMKRVANGLYYFEPEEVTEDEHLAMNELFAEWDCCFYVNDSLFKCPKCKKISFNEQDKINNYCGRCGFMGLYER